MPSIIEELPIVQGLSLPPSEVALVQAERDLPIYDFERPVALQDAVEDAMRVGYIFRMGIFNGADLGTRKKSSLDVFDEEVKTLAHQSLESCKVPGILLVKAFTKHSLGDGERFEPGLRGGGFAGLASKSRLQIACDPRVYGAPHKAIGGPVLDPRLPDLREPPVFLTHHPALDLRGAVRRDSQRRPRQ